MKLLYENVWTYMKIAPQIQNYTAQNANNSLKKKTYLLSPTVIKQVYGSPSSIMFP